MTDNNNNQPSGFIAGAALLGAAIFATIIMGHHPTLGGQGHESLAREAVAEAGINGAVHGAMIIFTLIFYYGLSALSHRLGNDKPEVRAGRLALSVATIAMVGAALISGFVVPGVAVHFTGAADEQSFRAQLILLSEANQVLAKTGAIAYAAAIFFLSLRLVTMKGLSRIAGGFGIITGLILLLAIITGHLTLNVHGMGIVVASLGIWFSIVAVQLMRGKI